MPMPSREGSTSSTGGGRRGGHYEQTVTGSPDPDPVLAWERASAAAATLLAANPKLAIGTICRTSYRYPLNGQSYLLTHNA